MFHKCIFLTFLVLLLTKTIHADDTRIVGGAPVKDRSQFKYQVSLRLRSVNNEHYCGGILIDDIHILTAAHCVLESDGSVMATDEVSVMAGSLSLDIPLAGEIKSNVKNIFTHDSYRPGEMHDDIAILRLENSIEFTDNIGNITLADKTIADGTICTVSGWGTIKEAIQANSKNLMFVEVPVVSQNTCKRQYPDIIVDGMMCAGKSGKDSCQGDSGGPLKCNGEIAGIVSFGIDCGNPAYAGVYTKVSEYRNWITQQQERSSSTTVYSNIFILFSLLFMTIYFKM